MHKFELADENAWRLRDVPTTATLTAVLSNFDLRNTFVNGTKPLAPKLQMVGQAFTLRYISARENLDQSDPVDNRTNAQRLTIEQIGLCDVLVIDTRDDVRADTLGAILAAQIKVRNGAKIIIDDAFRDSPVIAKSGIAAYARAAHTATKLAIHYLADSQQPIGCGDVAVYPIDIVASDARGVVMIPCRPTRQVAAQAITLEEQGAFIVTEIRGGTSLVGTYPPNENTLAKYSRSGFPIQTRNN